MSEQVQNVNPRYPVVNRMMPLQIKNIVQLLQQHSVSTVWEQAYRCPCVDVTTGQPKPNCSVCHGQGWVYLHPKRLDMAIQGDRNSFALTSSSMDELGTSQATPQITVNSVEQGIKPGDRITVSGWTTNETYTFNVTKQRLNGGIFLPYKVADINEALYIDDQGKLTELKLADNFDLKDNFLFIKSAGLLGKTISVSLEIVKRFYVVSLLKELRYQKYDRLEDKRWVTGNGTNKVTDQEMQEGKIAKEEYGNNILDYTDLPDGNHLSSFYPQLIKRDGAPIVIGKHQVFRLPPLLLLRRENLYFSNLNVVSSESDNKNIISDPRANDMESFIHGD